MIEHIKNTTIFFSFFFFVCYAQAQERYPEHDYNLGFISKSCTHTFEHLWGFKQWGIINIEFDLAQSTEVVWDLDVQYIAPPVSPAEPIYPNPDIQYFDFWLIYYDINGNEFRPNYSERKVTLPAGKGWRAYFRSSEHDEEWNHAIILTLKFTVGGEGTDTDHEPPGPIGPDPGYSAIIPSANKNYIIHGSAISEISSVPSSISPGIMNYSVDYYDGLGRPEQSVSVATITNNAKTQWKDNITLYGYDDYGREIKQWLPVSVNSSGAYVPAASIKTYAETLYEDTFTYSENLYENSPMSRRAGSYKPGNIFRIADKSTIITYGSNTLTDVFDMQYNSQEKALIAYPAKTAGMYSYESATDEDGGKTLIYKNGLGQKVMERVVNTAAGGSEILHDTYYVYEMKTGQLSVVIPPKATDIIKAKPGVNTTGVLVNLTDDEFWRLCYVYEYDSRNRCIEKRIPGSDWIYYVYDKADRLVAEQDAYWRALKRWKFHVYDHLSRLTETWASTAENLTRAQMQALADAGNTLNGKGQYNLLVNWYDKYSNDALAFSPVAGVVTQYDQRTQSLITRQRKAVIDSPAITSFATVETTFYYDERARLVQEVSGNHLGGISRISYLYDFVGNILTRHESHQPSPTVAADILLSNYTYDKFGRPVTETTTLNGAGKAFVRYGYNEIGQLRYKILGEGTTAVNEFYAYTTQGWLKEKKNDLFEMELRYYDGQKSGTAIRYSGDITEWEWQHKGEGANGAARNTYAFTYDRAGRLLDSKLYEGTDNTASVKFTEGGITYDANGNILTLSRYASNGGLTDNMTYTYEGNRLSNLRNISTNYTYGYDLNGNATKDGLQNLDLEYNYLDLIATVKSGTTLKAAYTWLSDGTKVRVNTSTGTSGNGFEYLGSLVYQRTNGALSLESASFGEGRIIKTSSTYTPNYFVTDHLGSTRVVINDGASFPRQDYYPFGMAWTNPAMQTGTNRYLYNGKEKQTTGELNYLDYGARMYDWRLVRWLNIDALAEKYYGFSPYVYAANSPIRYIDPDGRDWYTSNSGAVIWKDNNISIIMIDDEVYRNMGESYSYQMIDGNFINYYQNQAISKSNVALDATQIIVNNSTLMGALLGKDSPLSENSQLGLMTSIIHQAQNDFLWGAVEVGGMSLRTGGDAIATVGYAASASGIGAVAGVPLAALGNAMKYTGLAVGGIVDYRAGNYGKVGYDATTNILMSGVGQVGYIVPGSSGAILNLILVPFNQALGYGSNTLKKK